ncbi:hypothetical protein CR203_11460 [Salipaludibacillus neizhouensis]|uniref:Uncharacterized protein n=1 Tax=Salipaludibacillus neizhouensis TaxID=885475 RepID=A0A3A9K3X1_9BACI|nr:hypothetical protein CR203_11460 [Salipaludibacillus neizhouensis]
MMFFTDLPFDLHDHIVSFFEGGTSSHEHQTTDVHMFLPSSEKLTVEMVAGDGDIYIVENSMYPIIFDSVILHPLDSIVDKESLGDNFDQFIEVDENTGKEHLFAIPLDADSPLFEGLNVEHASSFIAVMMKDRPVNEFGLEILGEMYN